MTMFALSVLCLQLLVTVYGSEDECQVRRVALCKELYLKNTTYTIGRHVILSPMVPSDIGQFCSEDYKLYKTCIKPYQELCPTQTGVILHAYDFLCDDAERKAWNLYSACYKKNDTEFFECQEKFANTSWVTLYTHKHEGEKVVKQCEYMQYYMRCVHGVIEETACGKKGATWYTTFHRRSWLPFKEIIICDVYGPTGGVRGLVAGAIVAILVIITCFLFIWCRKKTKESRNNEHTWTRKGTHNVKNTRTSTSL